MCSLETTVLRIILELYLQLRQIKQKFLLFGMFLVDVWHKPECYKLISDFSPFLLFFRTIEDNEILQNFYILKFGSFGRLGKDKPKIGNVMSHVVGVLKVYYLLSYAGG